MPTPIVTAAGNVVDVNIAFNANPDAPQLTPLALRPEMESRASTLGSIDSLDAHTAYCSTVLFRRRLAN